MSTQNFIIVAKSNQASVVKPVSNTPIAVAGVQGPPGLATVSKSELRYSANMVAGVLRYTLTSLPTTVDSTAAYINGVQVEHTVDGVNLTITGYTAGEIDDTDELRVYY